MFSGVVTKEYLMHLGVTYVSRDGQHIMKGDKELHQRNPKGLKGYKVVGFYDPEVYKNNCKSSNTLHLGNVDIYVHRIVWAWYHGATTPGLVIDHINNNKSDNRLENLQELTSGENAWKDRPHDIYTVKCDLAKPFSYYQDKVERYKRAFDLAKTLNDRREYSRCSKNFSLAKAKVRYYLQNKSEES